MTNTTGVIVGKFAPLHQGHLNFIHEASQQCDELHVIMCWDEKFQKTLTPEMQKILSKGNRHIALIESFKGMENIKVHVLDESEMIFPEGSIEFVKSVNSLVGKNIDFIFTSEPSYDDFYKQYMPTVEHIIIDSERKEYHISATMIRNNPYKYWDMIAFHMKKYFVKKIAIIGVESTGKTTMARSLSNVFNTIWISEVGRDICEDRFAWHEEYMTEQDYVNACFEHKLQEAKAQNHANKILISDTNNLITCFSYEWFNQKQSVMLENLAKIEDYDLILFLDCSVKWVPDGMRQNNTPKLREDSQNHLLMLAHCYTDMNKVVFINSSDYVERFNDAKNAINNLLYKD